MKHFCINATDIQQLHITKPSLGSISA